MATAMENQTLPLGLASLWKGAGAKYCWHGVCNCQTEITGLDNRENEMYWYKGLDTNKILLKWYNMADLNQNYYIGGYAEAMLSQNAIDALTSKTGSTGYPYNIAAAFGVGHDGLALTSDELVQAAMDNSTNPAQKQVIVSNEVDFFEDFEANYGATLPAVTKTFGNEWDLHCASIAEVSAKIKRSLEKLRAAEAMAAIVTNYNPTFAAALDGLRKEAWMDIGLYWEHSLGFDNGSIVLDERNMFQRRLEASFSSYVDQLYDLAKSNLGNLITKTTGASGPPRFFVFNPLGWVRNDYADYEYSGSAAIHVVDVTTTTEVPFQIIMKNGVQYLRIEASNIPSLGYKVFEILPGAGTLFPNAGITSANIVENNFFKITYTNQGVLTSIIDKQNANKEIVSLTDGKYVNDLGTGTDNSGTSTIEYNGPVSVTILTTAATSPIIPHKTRITLFKNVPRIEIDNQITQGFDFYKTWSYSFNIANPDVWHEETGAVIRAKLTSNSNPGNYSAQNARYDWSTLNHFASVNETNYGVSLSNQDCYFMKIGNSSVNTLNENSAQLNVLAGGRFNNLGIVSQGGDDTFNQRFAITTHTSYSAAAEMKKALEHQNFMVCGAVTNPINFLLPDVYSYLNNSDPNSVLWSVKPAEEGVTSGTVARIWNLSDAEATPTLSFNLFINEAKRTTHVEKDMNNVTFTARDLPVQLGHNEMKTFRVKLNVIALPVKALSFSGDKIQSSNVLKWDNKGEDLLQRYELERSTNGQLFSRISSITAKAGIVNNYTYADNDINQATPYYYRLKMISTSNSYSYSGTILIKAAKEASNIIIFPNPVTDVLKANFVLDRQTRCKVTVINSAGAIVKTVAPPLFERGNNYFMLPVKELPAGEYIFSVTAGDQKFIKAFIKK
jgi:alpha-mannosidase